jgi:hypothetical protein
MSPLAGYSQFCSININGMHMCWPDRGDALGVLVSAREGERVETTGGKNRHQAIELLGA